MSWRELCLLLGGAAFLSCNETDSFSLRHWTSSGKEKAATAEALHLQAPEAGAHMNAKTGLLYQNFFRMLQAGQVVLGQQRATIVGLGAEAKEAFGDGQYSFKSDVKRMAGQHPGLLGIDVWDFAMKNPTWNQGTYGQAVRDFYKEGQGGLISMEWHMRGCDIKPVKDANGNIGIPGGGFMLGGPSDPQRSCVCRIVNEEPWQNGKSWLQWLYEEKLDKFAARLDSEGISDVPILFRPFHEQTGGWFWWGSSSWDCSKLLQRPDAISGPEAYKVLFRKTVEYLRDQKKLRNLIYVFSPDKLHYAPWAKDFGSSQVGEMSEAQLKKVLNHIYPGDEVVDAIGLDLYYTAAEQAEVSHSALTEIFRKNLRALTSYAIERGKVSALTETGNWNLHRERSLSDVKFFSKYMSELLFNDPQIRLAYVMFWENRVLAETQYYLPFEGHGQAADFKKFLENPRLLLFDDLANVYQQSREGETRVEFPICQTAGSDPDGDGWGWEDQKSCRAIGGGSPYPTCKSTQSDPDGDGWGWENEKSCRVSKVAPSYPICKKANSDPDGDGWGWEDGKSCQMLAEKASYPRCQSAASDPDGDGWGWENKTSCRVL